MVDFHTAFKSVWKSTRGLGLGKQATKRLSDFQSSSKAILKWLLARHLQKAKQRVPLNGLLIVNCLMQMPCGQTTKETGTMKKIICQRLTLDISHFQFHCLTKKLPFARNQLACINNNRSVAVFDELLTTVVELLNAIGAIWLQRVHILEAEGDEMPFLTFETRLRFCFLQSRAPRRDRDLFTYSQGSRQAQDFCSLNLRLRDKIENFCNLI